MVYVYVIKSLVRIFRCVGITDNPTRRIKQHQSGFSNSTKPYRPFKMILLEEYVDYKDARKREKFLKSGQGRKYLDGI